MRPKTRKRLLRFILIVPVVLVVLIGIAFGILYTQQQRLVGLALKELNKKFPGELAVGGSEISLFQNLPYISIALTHVQCYPDKQPGTKPIYEAERLYIGFSLPDILKQKYTVKAIALKNGHLDLVQEPDGQLNIVEASHITPDSTTATTTTSAALDLDIKKIVLKNMTVSYTDRQKGQHLITHIERIQSAFRDNDQEVDAGLDGKWELDFTRPGDTVLFRHKHVETDIRVSYEKATKLVRLTEGRLKLEEAVFNLFGTVDLQHDNLVDLRFSGDKPDFKQLFSFVLENVAKELKHFSYDGHLSF